MATIRPMRDKWQAIIRRKGYPSLSSTFNLRRDAEKWGITGKWPIAVDIGGSNGSDLSMGTFGMRGMPLNLIYDASGNLVKVHPGGLAAQDAVTLLTQLTEFGA